MAACAGVVGVGRINMSAMRRFHEEAYHVGADLEVAGSISDIDGLKKCEEPG